MSKLNETLNGANKVVSSVAGISLGLAVIAISAAVIKENVVSLFPKRKRGIKIHAVCIKDLDEDKKECEVPEVKENLQEPAPEKVPEKPQGDEAEGSFKKTSKKSK